jgi:hypothetical protein
MEAAAGASIVARTTGCASHWGMSTNLTFPLNQWTPLATNTLTQAGNFSFNVNNAINPSASQQFFTLQAQ